MHTYKPKTFRDRPLNIDNSGKLKTIRAKQPKGKWYNRRTAFGWSILLFLIIAPFLKINEKPFMLLDIVHRKFSVFGVIIWAQDSFLLAMIMIVTVVGIVLFTVAFGRVWCGWACPQTLFLEIVFRRIEYLFDGNYRKKKNPNSSPIKTAAKHFTFFITSVFFTHIFLNWFTGPARLFEIITSPISENLLGFMVMLAISIIYYWIYAFFREQVCTLICPYGRMQSVLVDFKTISVIYDYKRGEPRGANREGDCIDCKQCISVCPTGIDIKNGNQLECINCTACIDECNIVMEITNKPPNLIRFDSANGVETDNKALDNARIYAYSIVLIILFVILGFTVANRKSVETSLLRLPGTMYQEVDAVTYSNIYNLKIINKTNIDKHIDIKLIEPFEGEIQLATSNTFLDKQEAFETVLILRLKNKQLTGKSTLIKIGVYENETLLETFETNFIGSVKKKTLNHEEH